MDKIIIFHPFLRASGGSERITLEEERYLRNNGFDPVIITFDYKQDLFNGVYEPKYLTIDTHNVHNWIFKIIKRVLSLRRIIQKINPVIISACNSEGCVYAYLSTFFTNHKYFSQLPSSGYDNISAFGETIFTYVWASNVFSKGYKAISESTPSHRMNLPDKFSSIGFKKRLFANLLGLIVYQAVKEAKRIFVLSRQVQWEIKQLYNKDSIVAKGAFSRSILNYKPRQNIRKHLGIENKKVLFSLCRLVPKKRVDWLIKAVHILLDGGERDVVLVIGGTGPSEPELKQLTKDLNLGNRVIFAGFISEDELYDYYSACDLFVSADYADYDITAYAAIAFNKNIVWPVDHEMDPRLAESNKIFPSDLSPEGFAKSIQMAINSDTLTQKYPFNDYSWETYFQIIYHDVLEHH